jgi:MFS family permease
MKGVTVQPDTPATPSVAPPVTPATGLRALRALPRIVWLLGLASLLNDVSSEAIFPLLPQFLALLGAPVLYLGLIEGSADALACGIKAVAGRLSDRGPRRLLVTSGYTLPALARAGIALATAPWHVMASRLLDRAGKGIRSGPRDALLAESVTPLERGRAFGLNRSMDHLGAAIGLAISTTLIALGVSLRATFSVAAGLGLLAPIVLFFRLRDVTQTPRPHEVSAPAQRAAFRPGFSGYLFVCFLFALGNSSDAFLLVRAREIGWANIPMLWLFHHLVKSAAALPGGALSDRHSRAVVVSAGWAAYALTYVGFAFATKPWQIATLFLAYALYHGLAEGAERAIVADLAERGDRGRAFGLYYAFVGLAALPAGLATGLVWERWGARSALGMNAVCAALAAIVLCWQAFAGSLRRSLVIQDVQNPVRAHARPE